VNPYFSNIRKEISKMPKVYFHDLWLRNFLLYGNISTFQPQDIWELVENFIYNELQLKRSIWINYYRTISKSEIDFIFQKSFDEIIPIEVKFRNKVIVPEAIRNFKQNYPQKVQQSIIFTKDTLELREGVYFIPSCLVSFLEM
jgi:predicted AAA+ superfamily ATPase